MLKQNLNDQCFSMANIFSFAEKVIPDFKNKSEGDKFLFLYCITAKLLSNRLYDNESAADKINCLLDRITKSKDKEDKRENMEQLKNLLETFVGGNDFSVEKVKSFFDTNKDLLNKIYENKKPADLLFFFAQMRSKNIFKEENNEAFVKVMKDDIAVSFKGYNALEEHSNHIAYYGKNDICILNNRSVSKSKINTTLEKDPNRIFNGYLTKLDKEVGLDIFDKNIKKYERGFKLFGREQNYEQEDRDIYVNQTLDIDKILKEKFGFKKIKEISKDELEKLNLNYDEEFIYFLASNDFSNEYAFQNSGRVWDPFYSFTMPENIKPEITLKIYDYFVKLEHQSLINTSIDYLQNKFETSKDLLNAYDKLKDSLSFNEDKLLNIFI
ncbi:MAG: hypothetical protein IJU86_04825 [Firmicutes bacterium]|nr:hypothetical protein [Bacillota bacterium]